MTDAIDLTTEQRKMLNDLLRRFLPGVAVWAYGSRVKWTARPNSDLDLVAFATPAQRAQVSDLKDAFAESNLPFPVDLHVWDDVPERFREIIRKEYVVVQEARQHSQHTDMAVEQLLGPVQREWEYTTLGDVCKRGGGDIQTGPFGSQLHASDYVSAGIPSIMPQNIGDNRIIEEGIARITPEDAKRLSRYLVRKGDIVYSRRGDVERHALVREHEDGWLCGTGCLRVRPGEKGADSRYVSFYLGHPSVREWIVRHAHGATMPNLNTSILGACPFVIPPPNEQRAIAHILGTLDDKIELNRRMNETLEAMARAIFKSWFMYFDPVRAKAEGRDTSLPKPLADLFPDSFEDSEMGEIPKGWEVRSIYEIADIVYGAPFASSQFNTEGIGEPLIRIRDLANESPGVWTPEVHPKGYKVRSGDIVVGMDGEFRAYLWGGAEAWLNQRVCVFLPKGDYSAAFVRNSIIEPLAQVESTETATTVIHLGKSDIDRFCVVIPTAPVLAAFNQSSQPWYDRIVAAKREAQTLTALRDTLLPKLISGEMRVKDVERFIERGCEPTARNRDSFMV